jgi:hypothetical protein
MVLKIFTGEPRRHRETKDRQLRRSGTASSRGSATEVAESTEGAFPGTIEVPDSLDSSPNRSSQTTQTENTGPDGKLPPQGLRPQRTFGMRDRKSEAAPDRRYSRKEMKSVTAGARPLPLAQTAFSWNALTRDGSAIGFFEGGAAVGAVGGNPPAYMRRTETILG